MQANIRIFDFKISSDEREILHSYVDQILDEGFLTNHNLVKLSEESFLSWSGTKYAVAVNNGSSALIAALQVFRQHLPAKKRKVILPSNTFIACWFAVIEAGFEPVIMDSSKSFLGYDLSLLKKEFESDDVAAVLVVHIGGIIDSNLTELLELCKSNQVLVVEDAAHAHGSHLQGKLAGSFGDISTFSFHLTKTVTAGEGGMVCTSNKEFYETLLSVRQFGKSDSNPHLFERMGGNYKMSEMQAAFLLTDLTRAQKRIQRRSEISHLYFDGLKDSRLTFFKPGADSECSFYKCMALLPNDSREELLKELSKHNIQLPNGVYYWPLHTQPVVKAEGHFPNTDQFSRRHICLPCYPELEDEQVQYFIETFKRCESAGLV